MLGVLLKPNKVRPCSLERVRTTTRTKAHWHHGKLTQPFPQDPTVLCRFPGTVLPTHRLFNNGRVAMKCLQGFVRQLFLNANQNPVVFRTSLAMTVYLAAAVTVFSSRWNTLASLAIAEAKRDITTSGDS